MAVSASLRFRTKIRCDAHGRCVPKAAVSSRNMMCGQNDPQENLFNDRRDRDLKFYWVSLRVRPDTEPQRKGEKLTRSVKDRDLHLRLH